MAQHFYPSRFSCAVVKARICAVSSKLGDGFSSSDATQATGQWCRLRMYNVRGCGICNRVRWGRVAQLKCLTSHPLLVHTPFVVAVSQDLTTYDYIVQEQRKERERKERRRKLKVRVLVGSARWG